MRTVNKQRMKASMFDDGDKAHERRPPGESISIFGFLVTFPLMSGGLPVRVLILGIVIWFQGHHPQIILIRYQKERFMNIAERIAQNAFEIRGINDPAFSR